MFQRGCERTTLGSDTCSTHAHAHDQKHGDFPHSSGVRASALSAPLEVALVEGDDFLRAPLVHEVDGHPLVATVGPKMAPAPSCRPALCQSTAPPASRPPIPSVPSHCREETARGWVLHHRHDLFNQLLPVASRVQRGGGAGPPTGARCCARRLGRGRRYIRRRAGGGARGPLLRRLRRIDVTVLPRPLLRLGLGSGPSLAALPPRLLSHPCLELCNQLWTAAVLHERPGVHTRKPNMATARMSTSAHACDSVPRGTDHVESSTG